MPTTILVTIATLAAGALAYLYWPRQGTSLYAFRFAELMDDMRARGLSPRQQQEELTFRRALVRLRRRASEWAVKNPRGQIREQIATLATEEAKRITDRDLARRFLKVARDSEIGDILYPVAMQAIVAEARRRYAERPLAPVSDDEMAAVTTRR